jgi:perosamine synthetase
MTVGGDGGMILTNDEKAADRMSMLKNHGRKDKYLHEIIGMNMRMPEIPAAIGRTQLKKMPWFIQRRKEIVKTYNDHLSSIKELQTPVVANWAEPVFYVYTIQADNRDSLADFMRKRGVESGIYYPVPLHLQPVIIEKVGTQKLPITEKVCNRILSPPLSPVMNNEEVDFVIQTIKDFYKKK